MTPIQRRQIAIAMTTHASQWRMRPGIAVIMAVALSSIVTPGFAMAWFAIYGLLQGLELRLLALAANVMDHQVTEYRDAGLDSFVAKPIEVRGLLEAIGRAVASSTRGPQTSSAATPGSPTPAPCGVASTA
jgi:CheY-like chemotaxis protein